MSVLAESAPKPLAPKDEGADDLPSLWRAIAKSGGIPAWVAQRLAAKGVSVTRGDSAEMSDRERETYKRQLKQEAASKTALKRLAWAAYKSTHIVHLGEGVFWNDLHDHDKWDAPDAEERLAAFDLPRFDSPDQLAEALGLTVAELRWLTYHRDAATVCHYRRFTIPKRGGGQRAIWAPQAKLKAAQEKALRLVAEKLPVHGAAHGFLAGRSILTNARCHVGSRLLVQLDIANFFPSVSYRRVKGLFRRAGYRDQTATLLALLATEPPRQIVEWEGKTYYVALGPRCLPQGAPTSPAITNALCLRMDRRLTALAGASGYRYTRYADDLTFSLPSEHVGPAQVGKLLGAVRAILDAEGFRIHPRKTRVSRLGGRQKVTGLVVNTDRPDPRVPRQLKRELRVLRHRLAQGLPLRADESPQQVRGLVAYLAMVRPPDAEATAS